MYLINERRKQGDIMHKETNNIDGLEVFVKVENKIPLTDGELEIFNNYDEEEKRIIFDFIHNPSFAGNLANILKKIKNSNEYFNNIENKQRKR